MWQRPTPGPAHNRSSAHRHQHKQSPAAPSTSSCHSPDQHDRNAAYNHLSLQCQHSHHRNHRHGNVHGGSSSILSLTANRSLRHHPRLHFPPPPSYPPSDMEEYLNTPGPSTRPDPPWPTAPPPGAGEYSYAYLEEGVAEASGAAEVPFGGPYREGSYRTRHTYLTRYGTEENIYEEISDLSKARRRAVQQARGSAHEYPHLSHHQESIASLHQSLVEEEVRRVQSGHMRVLGELNLSVEAMLMPSNSREGSDDTDRENEDQLADLLTVGPTDELLSPVALGGVDLDSGFSGSSSSASYRSAAGSLRRGPERPKSGGSGGGKATTPNEGGSHTKGFWGKKAWKKIASFPSNISLNKNKGQTIAGSRSRFIGNVP